MKANYHTHTQRCLHAVGAEEDYVKSAIASGLSCLGLSDHAPFPDWNLGMRMAYEELPEYLAEIDRLAEKYASRITLHKALEIEYIPQEQAYYERLYREEQLDYLLLGEHVFFDDNGRFYDIYHCASTEEYLFYANSIAKALDTGLFPVVAHPDLFSYNPHPWDENCEEASRIIMNAALKHGTVLEFNANGVRRGLKEFPDGIRYPYPIRKFWE